MAERHKPAVIVRRQLVAEGTLEVVISRPASLTFAAGQYIQVGLKRLVSHDSRGASRVFSIVSSPGDSTELAFAFRRSSSGFKHALEHAPVGTPVMLAGPYGFITLTRKSQRPRILVASGIGITPFLSMIRFAREEDLGVSLSLLYVNSSSAGAAYLDELQDHASQLRSFELMTRFGALRQKDLELARASQPEAAWLISGSATKVAHTRSLLRTLDVSDNDIVSDEFVGY